MTVREQEIFMRGIAVGMRACQEFETGLPQESVKAKEQAGKVVKTRKPKGKRMPWTEEEKKTIVDNPTFSAKELHELIPNHNANSIHAMRSIMGLKKEKVEEVDNGLAKLGQQ